MSRSVTSASSSGLEVRALARALGRSHTDGSANGVHVLDEVDSTNAWLTAQPDAPHWHASVCVARVQRAGRGRRGRVWESRTDDDIPLSVAWRFGASGTDCSGLSLGVGVALAQVAQSFGAEGVGIKWPNDLVHNTRKLAGVLIQTTVGQKPANRGVVTGVVVGVGLNVSALNHPERIGLEEIDGVEPGIDRNALAARLAAAMFDLFGQWEQGGLGAVRDDYARFDILQNQSVTVTRPQGVLTGTALGIDDSGALLVRSADGEIHHVHAGDATLGGYGAGS